MVVSCSFLLVATPLAGVPCGQLYLPGNQDGTPLRGSLLVGQHNLEIALAQGVQYGVIRGIVSDKHINLIDVTELGQLYATYFRAIGDDDAPSGRLQHAAFDFCFGQVDVCDAANGINAITAEKNSVRVDALDHQSYQRIDKRILHWPERATCDNDGEARNG